MLRQLMKSKIHRATVTAADLHYEGSLTVDALLLEAADLQEHEMVDVVNVNNGSRLTTYVIRGAAGSGVVQLNGAAARMGMPGDLVIVIAYAGYDATEAASHAPRVVFVDAANRIVPPALPANG